MLLEWRQAMSINIRAFVECYSTTDWSVKCVSEIYFSRDYTLFSLMAKEIHESKISGSHYSRTSQSSNIEDELISFFSSGRGLPQSPSLSDKLDRVSKDYAERFITYFYTDELRRVRISYNKEKLVFSGITSNVSWKMLESDFLDETCVLKTDSAELCSTISLMSCLEKTRQDVVSRLVCFIS